MIKLPEQLPRPVRANAKHTMPLAETNTLTLAPHTINGCEQMRLELRTKDGVKLLDTVTRGLPPMAGPGLNNQPRPPPTRFYWDFYQFSAAQTRLMVKRTLRMLGLNTRPIDQNFPINPEHTPEPNPDHATSSSSMTIGLLPRHHRLPELVVMIPTRRHTLKTIDSLRILPRPVNPTSTKTVQTFQWQRDIGLCWWQSFKYASGNPVTPEGLNAMKTRLEELGFNPNIVTLLAGGTKA